VTAFKCVNYGYDDLPITSLLFILNHSYISRKEVLKCFIIHLKSLYKFVQNVHEFSLLHKQRKQNTIPLIDCTVCRCI